MWFDLPALLKAFQCAHQERRVDGLHAELCQDRPLVLDELHRIAGKPKLQQFVLTVLRAREALRSPTVTASRWHPNDIRDLDPALATLVVPGFVAAIERPGPLGRLRYLRALEGAAVAQRPRRRGRVIGAARCTVRSPSCVRPGRSRAARRCRRSTSNSSIRPRVRAACAIASPSSCGGHGRRPVGKRQGRAISRARKVLAHLCLQQGLSGSEVGRFLGGRTRAAVSYMALSLQEELVTSANCGTGRGAVVSCYVALDGPDGCGKSSQARGARAVAARPGPRGAARARAGLDAGRRGAAAACCCRRRPANCSRSAKRCCSRPRAPNWSRKVIAGPARWRGRGRRTLLPVDGRLPGPGSPAVAGPALAEPTGCSTSRGACTVPVLPDPCFVLDVPFDVVVGASPFAHRRPHRSARPPTTTNACAEASCRPRAAEGRCHGHRRVAWPFEVVQASLRVAVSRWLS
jgi:hypothetical protein